MVNYWLEFKEDIEDIDFIEIENNKYSMKKLFKYKDYLKYKEKLILNISKTNIEDSFTKYKISEKDEIVDFSFISLFLFEVFFKLTQEPNNKELEEYLRKLLKIKGVKYNFLSKKLNSFDINHRLKGVFLFIDNEKHTKYEEFYFPILVEIVDNETKKGKTFKEIDNENINLKAFVDYLVKKTQRRYMKGHNENLGRIDQQLLGRIFWNLDEMDAVIGFFKNKRPFEKKNKYKKRLEEIEKEINNSWFEDDEELEIMEEKKQLSLQYLKEIGFAVTEEEILEYVDDYGCKFNILDLVRIKTIRTLKEKITIKNNIMDFVLSPIDNDFVREMNDAKIEDLLNNCTSTNVQKLIKANRNVLNIRNMLSMFEKVNEIIIQSDMKPSKTLGKYYYDYINSKIKYKLYFKLISLPLTKTILNNSDLPKEFFLKKTISQNAIFRLVNGYIFGGKQLKKSRQKAISTFLFQEKRDRGLDFQPYIFELYETDIEKEIRYYFEEYMLPYNEGISEEEEENYYNEFLLQYKKELNLLKSDLRERIPKGVVVF